MNKLLKIKLKIIKSIKVIFLIYFAALKNFVQILTA